MGGNGGLRGVQQWALTVGGVWVQERSGFGRLDPWGVRAADACRFAGGLGKAIFARSRKMREMGKIQFWRGKKLIKVRIRVRNRVRVRDRVKVRVWSKYWGQF